MLTIFTTCKPFEGHSGIIQRNAIHSWTLLWPDVEIILIGDEEGTAEVAQEYGLRHVPEVERTEHGTPLVSSLFAIAEAGARYDVLCYVNADIMLLDDFAHAVEMMRARGPRRFLMAGERWNVDMPAPMDFAAPDWRGQLRSLVTREGNRFEGFDYFVFTKGVLGALPGLAVGRVCWDRWLLWHAQSRGAPLVDATRAVTAVHQDHDYAHLSADNSGYWRHPDAVHNREMTGYGGIWAGLRLATWIIEPDRLRRLTPVERVRRQANILSIRYPRLKPAIWWAGFQMKRARSSGELREPR